MTEKEKMLRGDLYTADDAELAADGARAAAWVARYNAASAAPAANRHAMLVAGMGQAGKGAVVRSPFHCDYGYNIHLEDGVFLNFGCIAISRSTSAASWRTCWRYALKRKRKKPPRVFPWRYCKLRWLRGQDLNL